MIPIANQQFYPILRIDCQNHPNPFTDRTTIEYGFPSDYQQAELWISDMTGKRVTKKELSNIGEVDVYFNDLGDAGIYLYSLVIDGERCH